MKKRDTRGGRGTRRRTTGRRVGLFRGPRPWMLIRGRLRQLALQDHIERRRRLEGFWDSLEFIDPGGRPPDPGMPGRLQEIASAIDRVLEEPEPEQEAGA